MSISGLPDPKSENWKIEKHGRFDSKIKIKSNENDENATPHQFFNDDDDDDVTCSFIKR